jgi:tRNA (cytidine/uridine-2'-O-)-methyltransferase
MFHIVLYEPEIPPNTGNVIRLCANTGARLHLIEPLGFSLEDKQLRRAGLDYGDVADVRTYENLDQLLAELKPTQVYAYTTRGRRRYSEVSYRPDDVLLFGPETRGLPAAVLDALPEPSRLRLPLKPGNRSLNLSNTVAAVLYEAWRQNDFNGGA